MALIKAALFGAQEHPQRQHERDCAGLVRQLNESSAEARRWAARDMADCHDNADALVERLRIEQDESVREFIFTTLTRIGDRTAVDGLVEFLRSEDAVLRNEAIEAMKQLPDAVTGIMQGLLNDVDSDVRIFAINVLESLPHPAVEQWLTEIIERDAHVNVCATAVDLLGEVGSRAVLEPVLRLKSRFAREPYIQFAADLAIKRILEG